MAVHGHTPVTRQCFCASALIHTLAYEVFPEHRRGAGPVIVLLFCIASFNKGSNAVAQYEGGLDLAGWLKRTCADRGM